MRGITIVTTAGRPDAQSEALARYAADCLQCRVVPRNKRSVQKLSREYDAHVLVAGKTRYEYFAKDAAEPFFFHPNSAAFRLKRIARGEHEPLLEATKLEAGMSFLDCTLGIGSDSLVAAFVVGTSGRVVGVEANDNVAFIVREGMKTYDTTELPLTSCMRIIEVVSSEAVAYLRTCADNSFDVVYIDPMFEQVIEESTNFTALREAGEHFALTTEWVNEAKRVAKCRVVLKAHYTSALFTQYDFEQQRRDSAKFHYGVWEKTTG
ncbi:class I SAM-dependent methyltransferase [Caryophanon latum]|uniref:SAM-dependent methyltransferase n=1 Tax=Caryophanon latum TaxID=33977 RepID=A0A1C0YUN8_9BACL|nr:class I SAM-dependent methyltransferase [Caryophanon latum]OCS90870.1 hypothetical protein A6K76_02120 [Caryophanon latum]